MNVLQNPILTFNLDPSQESILELLAILMPDISVQDKKRALETARTYGYNEIISLIQEFLNQGMACAISQQSNPLGTPSNAGLFAVASSDIGEPPSSDQVINTIAVSGLPKG